MPLESLPTELLHQIVSFCTAQSVFTLSLTSHKFYNLIDNRIWRILCQKEYTYWAAEHDINSRYEDNVSRTDWRLLFVERRKKQQEVTRILDSILESQTGRIDKFQRIVDLGYDAKDCLLKHLKVNSKTEDWLARRWYSDAVLGCLHRARAIEEWSKTQDDGEDEHTLERALSAYDMFVLHDRQGDFEETRTRLDEIAAALLKEDVDFDSKTIRQKALSIASYLVRNQLVGVRNAAERRVYHELRNNFMGYALYDQYHGSLPLQSATIYCSIARRLGIEATPCAMPFHVFVLVRPPQGMDVDDHQIPEGFNGRTDMFLDPFDTDQEVSSASIVNRLNSVGAPLSSRETFFEPASITDLVLRTGRNILTSVQENYRTDILWSMPEETDNGGPIFSQPDLEGAFYGALWGALIFGRPSNGDGPVIATINRRAYLPPFVEHFETHFPMDAALIERYIIPSFQQSPECDQLRDSVRVMRSVDLMPKEIKPRTKEISDRVHYRVGQVFKHKRYNYIGVITGWDIECGANEHWMARMRVHELAKGQNQSFYHVLVEDKSVRYVAEENILLIKPEYPSTLMALAGRHFKRWDPTTHSFISNIKDEYPDD